MKFIVKYTSIHQNSFHTPITMHAVHNANAWIWIRIDSLNLS
jgi:hypothetical protein